MEVQTKPKSEAPSKQAPQGSQVQEQTREWTTVTRKGARNPPVHEQSAVAYVLYEEDWSELPMDTFQLGKAGVHMPLDQAAATKLADALKGSQHSIALLTIEPLPQAPRTEKVVFRAKQSTTVQGQKVSKEKILTGYLNQFHTRWVRPQLCIATLSAPTRTQSATIVITLATRKDLISADSWCMISQYATPKAVKEGLSKVCVCVRQQQ